MTPQEIKNHWGPKDPDRHSNMLAITPRMLNLVDTFERGGDLDTMWNGLRQEDVFEWAFGPLTVREPVPSDQIRRDLVVGQFIKLVREHRANRQSI